MQLSTAELQTLEVIFNKDQRDTIPRSHLEKLSRLDLIEPAGCNVAVSLKGKEILFRKAH
jgi:hypothetical protein